MAIIYSYPTVTPTSADLLVGTSISSDGNENETRTFTIGDIIGLVPAAGTGGTVTRVKLINTDGFVTITNPEVTTAGDITVDLTNNGGTANNTTYYRGDGQWAVPPGTTASHQYTISASNNAPNVDILLTDTVYPGTPTFVKLVNGAGINMSESSNQITVTNTGVNNIVSGTFINVNTSTSGGTAQSPIVDLSATGLGTPTSDYYLRGDNTWQTIAAGGTMSSWNIVGDTGAAEQVDNTETVTIAGGTGVSTVTSTTNTVTVNLDSAVPTSIVAGSNIQVSGTGAVTVASANSVQNSPNPVPAPDVTQITNIVALKQAQYNALTPVDTHLYIITA